MTAILGLSHYYHDAAAALVVDGRPVAAAAEERFSRKKHDHDFPAGAIAYCLEEAGLSPGDLDHVIFYEKPFHKFHRILVASLASWPRSLVAFAKGVPPWLRQKLFLGSEIAKHLSLESPLLYCQHHLAHSSSAFYPSPFEEAAILSVDGVGEWETTATGVGEGNRIRLDRSIHFPHSIGLLYSAITSYLGFRVNDAEWKVMGLASYGEPSLLNRFRKVVDQKEDGGFRLDMRYFAHHRSSEWMFSRRWEKLFGAPRRRPEAEITDFHRDVAASGQALVEEMLLVIARDLRTRYGKPNLCVGGGVGLNSVANWRMLIEAGFERIFIQPAAGDDGGALGSALWVWHGLLEKGERWEMRHACLGPSFDPEEIERRLTREEATFRSFPDEEALIAETVELITAGNVVGWFQGRMEFGPRALGARSILANPADPKMKEIINAKVKYREPFRPFAPSVAIEAVHVPFDVPERFDAPFMLLVPPTRQEWREKLGAITHVDGSARIQTVDPDTNPLYHRLLLAVGERTGVPVLLNTSFNVRGEPIVCTPEDAYRCFTGSGIDALVIGPFLVTEKPKEVDHERGMVRSVELEKEI